jgi:dTDP-4-dehydrorhamnose 3,5-epimerase
MKLIDGVITRQAKVMADERGRLAEILRADSDIFKKFGQVYYTTAYPGVVKAWHYHKIQTDYFFCLKGMTKLVIYDSRKESQTFGMINEFIVGEHNPIVVVIPPMVYHGFKAIGTEESLMINIPTEPYSRDNPDEYRLDPHAKEIPYDWARKDG